ncbi:MAG: class I SAM-dependent RNA methyltransferase [Lachnospiraceae bacterium]|nr:class I SAM-dependent RNA methyltransferase [Lachnospiraceae bacterium]
MEHFTLIAPCHFGMESVLKNEIYDLGYEILSVEDGRVEFEGDAEAIVRANICLRTAERILLKAGSFRATSFEELFQGIKKIAWETFLPKDAKFWVTKAASVKSKLFSPSDIQSVAKKAMVEEMAAHYRIRLFPEDGAEYPVRIFIKNDVVTVGIDTTGDSLHKRGYRTWKVKAPIAENLAAGLLMLTPWKADRILVDPFCGSGTFPIEAALMAANIAPGLKRDFTAMRWTNLIPAKLWEEVREEMTEEIDTGIETDLQGYDIDPSAIETARHNAKEAGVDHLIHFQVRPIDQLSHPKKYGFLITNPPYGERLMEEEKEALRTLYRTLGDRYRALDDWSMYVITAYENCEKDLGLKAAKNRKIYNGMLKSYFYSFPGARPPKRRP